MLARLKNKLFHRAIDKHGVSIDFFLTASRDKGAAIRFLPSNEE